MLVIFDILSIFSSVLFSVAGGDKVEKLSSTLHVIKASALVWLSIGLLLGKVMPYATPNHTYVSKYCQIRMEGD